MKAVSCYYTSTMQGTESMWACFKRKFPPAYVPKTLSDADLKSIKYDDVGLGVIECLGSS